MVGIDRRKCLYGNVTMGKRHTRQSVAIGIRSQRASFVHGFPVGVGKAVGNVDNARSAKLFSLAIGPPGETLIDIDSVVHQILSNIDSGGCSQSY